MSTNELLDRLRTWIDANKRTIDYGDVVVDYGYLEKFIESYTEED